MLGTCPSQPLTEWATLAWQSLSNWGRHEQSVMAHLRTSLAQMHVFYHATTNETLGYGQLTTLGYPEDQCSYHSELSGLYGIATTILESAQFHNLRGGTIKVACNGKSALHRCFKLWLSNPLAKHFNIIQATRASIATTPVSWTWEHIWGHQDEMQHLLLLWNNVMWKWT